MRKTVLDMVCELSKANKDIFFIGSDLSPDLLKQFKEAMPERSFMEGISEANLIGMAAGLALERKIVYVNTIATFLTRRCFEQIVVDLCLHNVNVRLIGNGGGLVYAPLGPTHQAIDDIGILRTIPNMTILAPCDANEMKRLVIQTVDYKGPIYIRVAKGGDPIVSRDTLIEIGKAVLVREGKDGLIVTTGITLKIALEAAKELEKDGINVSVLHYHTVKPFDKEALIKYSNVPLIVSVEEHTVIGGLGGVVAEASAELGRKVKRIGIPDVFAEHYGSQESLMEEFGITKEGIVRVMKGNNKKNY